MPPARQELGRALKINASAIGPPGQRHFRLEVEAEGGNATFWLEKEQLFNLAIAAKRVLATGSRAEQPPEQEAPPPQPAWGQELDFKVGRLLLAQEEQGGLFALVVDPLPAEEAEEGAEERSGARVRATGEQLSALAEEALEVCAAGRPQCPLCGAPMDPGGHTCVRSNGHLARDIR